MHFKKFLATAALCAAVPLVTTSCAYRAELNQGNYVEQDLVNQLSYGMSSDQVRYVLGSPMLIDAFDSSRWYYTSFKRTGWSDPVIKNLVLLFQGSTLVDMSGDFKKPASFATGNANVPKANSEDFELPTE